MASDSMVKVSTLGDHTGIGELVSLRIDLNGRLSTEGGLLMFGLSFDFDSLDFLANLGD
jgi:hypothetical protein